MNQKTSLDPTELIVLIIFAGITLTTITDRILLKLGNINPHNIFINTTIILTGTAIIILTLIAQHQKQIKTKTSVSLITPNNSRICFLLKTLGNFLFLPSF